MKKYCVLLLMVGFMGIVKAEIPIYPVSISKMNRGGGDLIALFQHLDHRILQSPDSNEVKRYLLPYNQQVVSYVKETYGEDLGLLFEPDDPMILFSGILIAQYETAAAEANGKLAGPSLGQCIVTALAGIKSVKELINSYNQLISGGANFSTVWGVVKQFIKRYVAWYMVGYTIYELGDCMNWW